ncbi:MAG TPA: dephospho-CoA kinase [Aggregatilinea sp.]|uniref:dephospho-CoA kinase n=1 Tax=Aggregatilinea sp. TaxID=2806333 RepID=UPI002BB9164D|nr:dephospho-CoA kinase [Aggregatilinea sp.]HML23788.1 dephospho-CoA kinase [Aggregatilinea sp.]
MSGWENKYVIGLTGNIATGKSLVRRMLEHLGAYTIDADSLAHQAMAPGAPAYKPVVSMFGRWILEPDGRIDRNKLAAVVFSHPEALARLEALTHPIIGQAISTLIKRSHHRVIVVEAIKLLESEIAGMVDTIWVVNSSEQQQIERLMGKRGMTDEVARKRVRLQPPQADKLGRANVIIDNSHNPEDTWKQVRAAWSRIQGAAEEETAHSLIQRVEVKPAPRTATAPAEQGKMTITSMDIVRGMAHNADVIARLIHQRTGYEPSRQEVIRAFGEKSYMLAMSDSTAVGMVGFLVENLVTRVDELFVIKDAPFAPVATALSQAVESASRDLQSEVGYVFLPNEASQEMIQALVQQGYERLEMDEIKIPAWREAVRESRPAGTIILSKKLRADRVLKPL